MEKSDLPEWITRPYVFAVTSNSVSIKMKLKMKSECCCIPEIEEK
jgi:hypothetical protein